MSAELVLVFPGIVLHFSILSFFRYISISMLLQIRHFIYTYLLDFIVCSISFFGVIFYFISFRMTYPSTIPNLTLISSLDQEQKQLYDLIEEEGIIHITLDSSTGFRNLQHLQRFAFTNNDVPIVDLHPSHVVNTQQEAQARHHM